MFVEISLSAEPGADYSARDLGFLLHKHPDNLHARDTNAGQAAIFYTEVGDARTIAVLHLDVDPVGLVRGKNKDADGLLDQYVNDRPYVANSFLSVALARSFGQSLSGKSKERQDLADRTLPFEVRVTPIAVAGGPEIIDLLFGPLGYQVDVHVLDETSHRGIYELQISGDVRLRDLLNHLYVLVPVLDNDKHYYIARDEIEKLVAKGEGWLAKHPAKDLIARRALKHRRSLVHAALDRLAEELVNTDDENPDDAGEGGEAPRKPDSPEEVLEKPIRLHDLRLDTVLEQLKAHHVSSVLDLGCGEGKLISRLIKARGFDRIVGVDPSVRTLEVATRRLKLNTAGAALRDRVQLQFGSLTYGDRRWQGFDAAVLVEVIEHIDPPRLSALELSVFGVAAPRLVIVTTPNREYNQMFETMAPDAKRHPDHRFEWTRAEFQDWADGVAQRYGYRVSFSPIGPIDETHGAPSQMAVFTRDQGMEDAA
ncbi:MAG: 3' terminal RNA ribose 2'-O-methyltransferase Hen1 [Pseudomonadota bacterium]